MITEKDEEWLLGLIGDEDYVSEVIEWLRNNFEPKKEYARKILLEWNNKKNETFK